MLKELILPYKQRVTQLSEFLVDVKPSLQYEIVPLTDRFGPSITDHHLKCIVVSEETLKGGLAVNRKRVENGLAELAVHEISLARDVRHSKNEEEKISSSSLRYRLLGTLLRPPRKDSSLPPSPYIIGLSGISGSGKSSIAQHLAHLGAFHLDVDALGHDVYAPGAPAYNQVVEAFGEETLKEDGTIDRAVLGAKVFEDRAQLKRLTNITWPVMAQGAKEKINEAAAQGATVCVLDAAVLLEAGWEDMVHEIWTIIVPEEEAVRRILIRDGISEEAAQKRLENQMPSSQRVKHSHVILCTMWEPEVTYEQAEKAWALLQKRLKEE